jgi:hypothetical protein
MAKRKKWRKVCLHVCGWVSRQWRELSMELTGQSATSNRNWGSWQGQKEWQGRWKQPPGGYVKHFFSPIL